MVPKSVSLKPCPGSLPSSAHSLFLRVLALLWGFHSFSWKIANLPLHPRLLPLQPTRRGLFPPPPPSPPDVPPHSPPDLLTDDSHVQTEGIAYSTCHPGAPLHGPYLRACGQNDPGFRLLSSCHSITQQLCGRPFLCLSKAARVHPSPPGSHLPRVSPSPLTRAASVTPFQWLSSAAGVNRKRWLPRLQMSFPASFFVAFGAGISCTVLCVGHC